MYELPWEKASKHLMDDPKIAKEKMGEIKSVMSDIIQDDDLVEKAKEMLNFMFDGEGHNEKEIMRQAFDYTRYVIAVSLSHIINIFFTDNAIKLASESIMGDDLDAELVKILGKDSGP